MAYWFLILLSSIALASPVEEIKSRASQTAYEVWTGKNCQDINTSLVNKLEVSTNCIQRTKAEIGKTSRDVNNAAEKVFFNYAAKKQVEILECQIKKLDKLSGNSKEADNFSKIILGDINNKLPMLRDLYKKIDTENEKLKSINTRLSRPDFLAPQQIDELIRDKKISEKKLADLNPTYQTIYSSIWSHREPAMSDYLDKLISSDKSFSDFEKKNPFREDVLKRIENSSKNDLNKLKKQYSAAAQTFDLNQETKELIIKRGDTFQYLTDLQKNPKDFEPLYCRLEGRYGKGTEYLENGIAIGSVFLGGLGILGDLAAAGRLTKVGIALNARQTEVAMSTAEVLLASSTAIGTMDTIQALDRCAPQNAGALSSFKTDNCSASISDLASFESQRLNQTNCVLDVALAALPLGANYGFIAGKKYFSTAERRAAEIAVQKVDAISRSKLRSNFVNTNLERNFTTEEQNINWIKIAEESNSGKQSDVKFLDIENSAMKTLNDSTKDKNFVTSLTNKNKEIVFSKIEELKKNNPGLEVSEYSDFKSSRFAFSGKVPEDLDKQLSKLFSEANVEYNDYLKKGSLVRTSDEPENWFRAGYGSTADEATLAARYSRKTTGNNQMQNFSNAEVKGSLQEAVTQSERLRYDLQRSFEHTDFMQKIPGTSKMTLSDTAFDVVRKSSTPEGAAEALNKIYGTQVTAQQAEKMKAYIKSIDEFSPGIHIAKRQLANLTEAEKGGISADFAGMGAANLAGTAKALAKSQDLKQAIQVSRQEEKLVTKEFLAKKNDFENKVNNYLVDKKQMQGTAVTCSGDDCVVVTGKNLDSKTKTELVQRLSKNENPSGMRVAFIGDQVTDSEIRNTLASHGESIEKILRKNLQGEISQDTLKQVLFSVDVNASSVGSGEMKLIVGNSRTKLSNEQLQTIQKAFNKSVQDFNDVLKKDKIAGEYKSKSK